jgi:hypothetical protein
MFRQLGLSAAAPDFRRSIDESIARVFEAPGHTADRIIPWS